MESEQIFYITHRGRMPSDIGEMSEHKACQYVHGRLLANLDWSSALTESERVIEEAKRTGNSTIQFHDNFGPDNWIDVRLIKCS